MLSVAHKISEKAKDRGWEVYIVGGFVRDSIFDCKSKDVDIEIFGPESVEELIEFLQQFGDVDAVGKSFGVLKLNVDGVDLDVSLPRTESKIGRGHKGFVVKSDGKLTPFEASLRRDYTFNAMMLEVKKNSVNLVDLHNGKADLLNNRLRHTSPQFADDPLRVLRGMQFCGRFNFTAEEETVDLCRSLLPEFETLAKERLWTEFEKWAAKSVKPSRGLVFLQRTGWIKAFPELNAIIGVRQGKMHHPEGSVWQHTKLVVDQAAKIAIRENLSREDRIILLLAALCHDFGKAVVSVVKSDEIVNSVGHDIAGVELAQSFLESIDTPKDVVKKVCILVREHMNKANSHKSVRRLANRLDCVSIKMLTLLIEADCRGRAIKKEPSLKTVKTILRIAQELKVEDDKPKPILMGRHLIEAGMKPGKEFGIILNDAFELQLDGDINNLEEAKEWLVSRIS